MRRYNPILAISRERASGARADQNFIRIRHIFAKARGGIDGRPKEIFLFKIEDFAMFNAAAKLQIQPFIPPDCLGGVDQIKRRHNRLVWRVEYGEAVIRLHLCNIAFMQPHERSGCGLHPANHREEIQCAGFALGTFAEPAEVHDQYGFRLAIQLPDALADGGSAALVGGPSIGCD